MPQTSVTLDPATYQILRIASEVAEVSIAELIRKKFGVSVDEKTSATNPKDGNTLPKHHKKIYKVFRDGSRVNAILDTISHRVQVQGKSEYWFSSPSKAARVVIRKHNPLRDSAAANGWIFWKDANTGEKIDKFRNLKYTARPAGT